MQPYVELHCLHLQGIISDRHEWIFLLGELNAIPQMFLAMMPTNSCTFFIVYPSWVYIEVCKTNPAGIQRVGQFLAPFNKVTTPSIT